MVTKERVTVKSVSGHPPSTANLQVSGTFTLSNSTQVTTPSICVSAGFGRVGIGHPLRTNSFSVTHGNGTGRRAILMQSPFIGQDFGRILAYDYTSATGPITQSSVVS